MAMPDSQRYSLNLNLTEDVEDNVVFLIQKVFISASFSIASYKQEMRKSLSQRNKKKPFKEQNHGVLVQTGSKKVLGYRCESGIAIFTWRVTFNYAYTYSPF